MEAFIVNADITAIDQLFGRKKEIDQLISCAKRKCNAGIIGARRFGKTCILKSMESYLMSHKEINAYPVYFDAKQYGIKNDTAAVYRTISALMAAKMCADGFLPEGGFKISRRCTLDVSDDIVDMKVQMEEWNREYQKDVFVKLADKLVEFGKYALLLLDEIDYLLLEALENPSDFSLIRSATADKSELKFWIAGTATWSSICTSIGSPELNCGLEKITLPPLEFDEFNCLWNNECSMIEDENYRELIINLCSSVYEKTGGVPFYGKFIGSHLMNNNSCELPNYTIIRDFLCEVVNNRFTTDIERSVLHSLAESQKTFDVVIPDGINALDDKGLVCRDGNTYKISIGYLSDYLVASKCNTDVVSEQDIEKQELEEIVSEISRLRDSVQKKVKSPINDNIFTTSTEDIAEFNTLKIQCCNEPTMVAFTASIYKLYYEGSDKGNNLPSKFINDRFLNVVRTLRHVYSHRECECQHISDDELFSIVNKGQRPITVEHFKNIQKVVLDEFRDELLKIIKSVSSQQSTKQFQINNLLNQFVFGNEYKGVVVVDGFSKLKIKCNTCSYLLSIKYCNNNSLNKDDNVIFVAKNEANMNDSSKTFWYATDVRLDDDV